MGKNEIIGVIKNLPTVFLIIAAGICAYIISVVDPAFDALFMALLLGIIFGSFFGEFFGEQKKENIAQKALSIALPIGIILYGANVAYPYGGELPYNYILLAVFSAFLLCSTVYYIARLNKLNRKFATLLACGSGICGASAIAIITPIIKPRKEDFSASLIVITIVGLTGAVIYPSLVYIFNLPIYKYALLSGTTLHQTGLVQIATTPYGQDLVNFALEIKAVRIALIAVAALVVSFFQSERRFYIPWYIVAFIVLAFLSANVLPRGIIEFLQPLSTLAFSITLAAVGFSVNLTEIQNVRLTPLFAAYLAWVISVALVLVLIGVVI